MGSEPKPGEEEGTGVVVPPSHRAGGVVAPSAPLLMKVFQTCCRVLTSL